MCRCAPVVAVGLFVSAACGPPVARTADVVPRGQTTLGVGVSGGFGEGEFPAPSSFGYTMRIGLSGRCDAGLELSLARLGVDSRCALLNTRTGDSVAIAPLVGVSYLPARGMEYRAGIDLGTEIGDGAKPFATIAGSFGSQFHLRKDGEAERGRRWQFQRNIDREWRLETTIGFAYAGTSDGEEIQGAIALTPFWILSKEPRPVPDGLGVSGGLSVLFGDE